jgi:hypothetical protein
MIIKSISSELLKLEMRLVLFLASLAASCLADAPSVYAGVQWVPPATYFLVYGDSLQQVLAMGSLSSWGWFNDTISQNGWTTLAVFSNASVSDEIQSYSAGYLEGALTAKRIWEYINNAENGETGFSSDLKKFVDENYKWVQSQISLLADTDDVWHQVKLLYTQNQGMFDGFLNKTSPKKQFTYEVFYAATLAGEKVYMCGQPHLIS